MLDRIALVVALTSLSLPAIAHAECFVQTAQSVMSQPGIEIVFAGELLELTRAGDFGTRVTFQVSRVWKGSVRERFDVYVWIGASEGPEFQNGRHYVVLAKTLTDQRLRSGLGLSGIQRRVFIPTNCSDAASLSPTLEQDLGRGYAPTPIRK